MFNLDISFQAILSVSLLYSVSRRINYMNWNRQANEANGKILLSLAGNSFFSPLGIEHRFSCHPVGIDSGTKFAKRKFIIDFGVNSL